MEGPCRKAVLAGGKYELVEEIGRGGMGTVWRAHALLLDRPCAIKFLKPEHAASTINRARFAHEARAAAQLRSAHIVTIFDVDFLDGVPFIAMELLPGESLERRLDRGPLSPQLTLHVVRQVALGLGKAHDAGLVHRDLKPDNIFLVEENPLLVKILDFGVAKSMSTIAGYRTVSGAIVGTPHYMSPEQAMGRPVDARSDLWALAVVTFRCLTGRLPFEGNLWPEVLLKIVQGEIPLPTRISPTLPRPVDRWWKEAMRRDPADRPRSAHALVDGLEEALRNSRPARSQELGQSDSAIRVRGAKPIESRILDRRAVVSRRSLAALCVIGMIIAAYFARAANRDHAPVEPGTSLRKAMPLASKAPPAMASETPVMPARPPMGKDVPTEKPPKSESPANESPSGTSGRNKPRKLHPKNTDEPRVSKGGGKKQPAPIKATGQLKAIEPDPASAKKPSERPGYDPLIGF